MYNMAIDKDFRDADFFQRIDNILNVKTFEKRINGRYAFGALYAYYTYGLGRQENILFFERYLEDNPLKLSKYSQHYNRINGKLSSS